MKNIIIAGIGTDVGKTIVSAIMVTALNADYWKPIQCGNLDASDSNLIKNLVTNQAGKCHTECYRLRAPLSPHHAARLEGFLIDPSKIIPPTTFHHLIIECAGGILVPLTDDVLQLNLFSQWQGSWILVSKHYLGSINHTLLSLEILRQRKVNLIGIVFNGHPNPDSERVIEQHAQVPFIGRLSLEQKITPPIIQQYAEKWKQHPYLMNLI